MAYETSKTKAGLNKGPRQEAVRVQVIVDPKTRATEHYYIAKSVFAIEHSAERGLWGRILHKNRKLWVKWDPAEAEWFVPWEHETPHLGTLNVFF